MRRSSIKLKKKTGLSGQWLPDVNVPITHPPQLHLECPLNTLKHIASFFQHSLPPILANLRAGSWKWTFSWQKKKKRTVETHLQCLFPVVLTPWWADWVGSRCVLLPTALNENMEVNTRTHVRTQGAGVAIPSTQQADNPASLSFSPPSPRER